MLPIRLSGAEPRPLSYLTELATPMELEKVTLNLEQRGTELATLNREGY